MGENWTVLEGKFTFQTWDLGSKWTVKGGGLNWTVQMTESGLSAKVDGPEIQMWTVQREIVRSEVLNLNGLKG